MLPILLGIAAGVAIPAALHLAGFLESRFANGLLLVAIAVFYPAFAIHADSGVVTLGLQTLYFILFCGLAYWGMRKGLLALAGGIGLHGVFDLAMVSSMHPAPSWWPVFCGTVDITIAAILFLLVKSNRITP